MLVEVRCVAKTPDLSEFGSQVRCAGWNSAVSEIYCYLYRRSRSNCRQQRSLPWSRNFGMTKISLNASGEIGHASIHGNASRTQRSPREAQ